MLYKQTWRIWYILITILMQFLQRFPKNNYVFLFNRTVALLAYIKAKDGCFKHTAYLNWKWDKQALVPQDVKQKYSTYDLFPSEKFTLSLTQLLGITG